MVISIAVGCAHVSVANAFVCSRTTDGQAASVSQGPSLAWFSRDIPFVLHSRGTNDLSGASEYEILRESFKQWGTVVDAQGVSAGAPVKECAQPLRSTDIRFIEARGLSPRTVLGFDFLHPDDNENILMFRDEKWLHPGQETTTLALTTTTFNPVSGEILDADIEFNTKNFVFTSTDSGADRDLMNTAAHEIGHLLGLAHSPVSNATMFSKALGGETEKRSLECDDLNAVVFKYPSFEGNGYCQPVSSCGFCAPPDRLDKTAIVTASDYDRKDGCAATKSGHSVWFLSFAFFVFRAWAQKRANAYGQARGPHR